MTFKDDGGGFAFSCDDAKFSIDASTWSTRLSQLGKMNGQVCILTGYLPNHDFICQIIQKRPNNIWIVAHDGARSDAELLKQRFPQLRIALHPKNNAKVVLIEPETVWISSFDFGKTNKIESAIGMHSVDVYKKTLDKFFMKIWMESTELIYNH